KGGFEGCQVDLTIGAGSYLLDLVAGHGGRGGVGAVSTVWYQDHLTRLAFAARTVVGADDEDARQLGVGTGGGLKADGVHAGDGAQVRLKTVEELERALRGLGSLIRMQVLEQRCCVLVDLG